MNFCFLGMSIILPEKLLKNLKITKSELKNILNDLNKCKLLLKADIWHLYLLEIDFDLQLNSSIVTGSTMTLLFYKKSTFNRPKKKSLALNFV